jgi:hypothetical protein
MLRGMGDYRKVRRLRMDASDGETHRLLVLLIPVGRRTRWWAVATWLASSGPRSGQQQLGLWEATERTLMSPRGGRRIGETTDLNFLSQKTWADSVHRSDRWWWPVRPVRHWTSQETPVRPVRLACQTGVAQSTCKNNFKHLLTSSTNQTWWVAFVDDHKQGNEPCIHK